MSLKSLRPDFHSQGHLVSKTTAPVQVLTEVKEGRQGKESEQTSFAGTSEECSP